MRARLQLVLAVVAAAACGWSWVSARSSALVAPVADGQPATTSILYDPALISLALVLAAVAGVLADGELGQPDPQTAQALLLSEGLAPCVHHLALKAEPASCTDAPAL